MLLFCWMLIFMLFWTNIFYGIIALDRMKLPIQIFDLVFLLYFITHCFSKTELFFSQELKKSDGVIYLSWFFLFFSNRKRKSGNPNLHVLDVKRMIYLAKGRRIWPRGYFLALGNQNLTDHDKNCARAKTGSWYWGGFVSAPAWCQDSLWAPGLFLWLIFCFA